MPEPAKSAESPALLFIYGTLWTGSGYRTARSLAQRCLLDLGPAWIAARLYDLGRYPAAVPPVRPDERVHGRLCVLNDTGCLQQLDAYEDCDSERPQAGLYRRELALAHLLRPGHRTMHRDRRWCWVYFFNGRLTGRPRIGHGDYRRWLRR